MPQRLDRDAALQPQVATVRQRGFAASRQGAEVVFVPEANWDDALSAPVDVELVKVATIDDALAWLGASAFAATMSRVSSRASQAGAAALGFSGAALVMVGGRRVVARASAVSA
jgi:hypothetical protein